MKKILITGATGFIGANLVRRLIKENYQVHILKRKDSDIWRIKDIISKLYTHDVDLMEKDRLSKLLKKVKPKVIFHLANLGLYAGIDPTITNSINSNLLGTINLIESADAIDYECFINTGSSSEYGKKSNLMRETDSCQPQSNYAITKLSATLYAQAYAKRTKKPLVTFRIFSPFGPFDQPNRLLSSSILKILKGEDIFLQNPFDVRDYIFIEDVVNAYLLCMKKAKIPGSEILNIGSGKQILIKDIIELLTKKIKSKSKIISDKNSINDSRHIWQADIQKAKKILGWQPKTTLEEGLKKTYFWFKKYSYLYE